MIFEAFPREIGFPVRRLVLTKDQFYGIINKYINIVDIYTSIYKFRIVEKGKPVYSSAVVDKVFVDIDNLTEYEHLMNIHKQFLERNIKHTMLFSGGGFHLYVFTEEMDGNEYKKKYGLRKFNDYLNDEFGLEIDRICVGDLARLGRIPNTYNFKRKRFCIPITDEIKDLGYEGIRERAKKQHFKFQIWGNNLIDLNKFAEDYTPEKSECDKFTITDFIKARNKIIEVDDDILKYIPEFPPFLDKIIERKKEVWEKSLGWKERALIIIWLKENAFSMEETLAFLRKVLTKSEFNHCVHQERQPYYIYRRDSTQNPYHFPNIQTLQNDGFELSEEDRKFLKENPLYIFN